MISPNKIPQIAELTIAEKILFLEEMWDEISINDGEIPVPLTHKKELDTRLNKFKGNPENLLSLEELQERIKHRK